MEAAIIRPSKRSRWSRSNEPEPVGLPPPPPPLINNFDKLITDSIMTDVVLKQMKLNAADALAFSQTCKRFSSLYQSSTKRLDYQNTHSNGLSLGTPLDLFLSSYSQPTILKSCNFNGLYWVPKTILGSFLVRCTSLEELRVAETQLTFEEIMAYILPPCPNITTLAFTLRENDQFHANRAFSQEQLKTLAKLTSVEVVMANGCMLSNLLIFLSKCVNLKEIVVLRAPHAINPEEVIEVIGPLQRLESFIFVAAESWPVSAQDHFLNVQDISSLKIFWSNVAGLNSSANENRDFIVNSLCWNVPRVQHIDGLENNFSHQDRPFRYSMLQSLNEPRALLMKPTSWNEMRILPSLKLVKCHYDGKTFRGFCDNHRLIEVLKLMFSKKPHLENGSDDPTERATHQAWNQQSWEMLQKLRILSIDAELISESRGTAYPPFPFMAAVFQSCQIQELEIFGPKFQWIINETELTSIAQCRSLKRLTLKNLRVKNGRFLKEILSHCTQLESLRMYNVGDRICCFFKGLKEALPLAKNLTTFCLFHNYLTYPQMIQLLDSLKQCPSLKRVSLVLPQSKWKLDESKWKQDEFEFRDAFFKLCCNLNQLVALFGVFSVPSGFCEATNRKLNSDFTDHRQAFRCDLQASTDRNVHDEFHSEVLPLVHGDTLTRFESQVAVLPFNFKSALHFE